MSQVKWPIKKKTTIKRPPDRQRSAYILLIAAVGGFVLFLQWQWLGQNQHLFAPFSLQRIDCDLCGKTGQVPVKGANNVLEMCPACYGVGYHTVRRFGEADVLCPACLGLGRLENKEGRWRTCRRCDGRGLIESGAEREEQEEQEEQKEHRTSNVEHSTSNEEGQPSTLDVGR